MNSNWKGIELGQLCDRLSSGKNLTASCITDNAPYPVYGGNGLRGYTENNNFEGECVLIGRQGAFCGNVRYFSGKAYITEHAVVAIANKDNDTRFLYYILSTQNLGRLSGQSAQPGLSVKTLSQQSILVPDLSTQRRIAAILSSLDDKIELNNKINANLQEQAQALFKSFYENSRKEVPFTDLVDILGGGTPKTGELSYWNGKIPFFTPKDASDLYAIITEKTITEEGLFHCNSQLYPKNTVFVTARGTVGKIALAGVPMAMNQSCYALVGKNIKQLLVYFYTSQVIKSLKNKASGSVFDAITTKDFYSEKVYVLDEIAEKEFCLYAEPVMELILQNGFQNLRLTKLRDTLLPKLMSGELDVSDIELSEVSDA